MLGELNIHGNRQEGVGNRGGWMLLIFCEDPLKDKEDHAYILWLFQKPGTGRCWLDVSSLDAPSCSLIHVDQPHTKPDLRPA